MARIVQNYANHFKSTIFFMQSFLTKDRFGTRGQSVSAFRSRQGLSWETLVAFFWCENI